MQCTAKDSTIEVSLGRVRYAQVDDANGEPFAAVEFDFESEHGRLTQSVAAARGLDGHAINPELVDVVRKLDDETVLPDTVDPTGLDGNFELERVVAHMQTLSGTPCLVRWDGGCAATLVAVVLDPAASEAEPVFGADEKHEAQGAPIPASATSEGESERQPDEDDTKRHASANSRIRVVDVEAPDLPNEAPCFTIRFQGDRVAPILIHLPSPGDALPWSWVLGEALTGVEPKAIISALNEDDEQKLCRLVESMLGNLRTRLVGREVQLDAEGQVDEDLLWRRLLARERRRQRGRVPTVRAAHPRELVERTMRLVRIVGGENLFVFGAEAGRSRGEYAMVLAVHGERMLEVMSSEPKLRAMLRASMKFEAPRAWAPRELVQDLLAFSDQKLRPIRGLTKIPVLRPDGSILDQPGYDSATALWYDPPAGGVIKAVPPRPTAVEIDGAVVVIRKPFAEFPWQAGAMAGAVACLMDQFVMPMVDGPRPLFVFVAPSGAHGTGKTLVPKIIHAVVTGRKLPPNALPTKEEEVEKRIQSFLLAGEPMKCWDNIDRMIDSPSIAVLHTSEWWQGRTLGKSEAPLLPNVTTWMATMNGGSLSKEIARRTITVVLDAGTEAPHKRTGFDISNVEQWALTHRFEVVRALLILARAWVVAGRPRDPELVLGSFESWVQVVGGILHHAGIDGLPDAVGASEARDTLSDEHARFVTAWLNAPVWGGPQSASNLAVLARNSECYVDKLGETEQLQTLGSRMRSKVLERLLGRIVAGHRVRKSETLSDGRSTYYLETVGGVRGERAHDVH